MEALTTKHFKKNFKKAVYDTIADNLKRAYRHKNDAYLFKFYLGLATESKKELKAFYKNYKDFLKDPTQTAFYINGLQIVK